MNKFWRNLISALLAGLFAYMYGAARTDSWYILKNAPTEDVHVIGVMLFIFAGAFACLRVLMEVFDCD